MLQLVKKLDFRFRAATTNIGVGSKAETGDAAAYDVWDGEKWTNEYVLDEQSIAEIGGIELIGPMDVLGVRSKLEYAELRIDGKEYNSADYGVYLNEMMAPPFSSTEPNKSPFFGGYVRVPDKQLGFAYEQIPSSFCHNIGVPMLMGGSPLDACPKVGPGGKISIEVRAPRAAEGGAAIVDNFIVRVSLVQCRTVDMFKKLGEHYGWLVGNNINQSFTFKDFEENGDVAEMQVDKTIDMTEGAGIDMDNWTELYGGLDAKKPYVYPYVRYANNAAATTTNSEFIFTKVGSNVLHDQQELDWNFNKGEAVKIEHIGVEPAANQNFTRVYVQGRDANPWSRTPNSADNEYPMPSARTQPPLNYNGPASVGRGIIVWNTKGNVGIMDNGTSIPAWAAPPTRGSSVGVWGKYYKFT